MASDAHRDSPADEGTAVPVLVEHTDTASVLTLNRPHRLNALDQPTRSALARALDEVHQRTTRLSPSTPSDESNGHHPRVVILTGAGRAFSAGQDLGARQEIVEAGDTLETSYNPILRRLRELPTPVIAAINGPAVGAAIGLALACDVRVISDKAEFKCNFAELGLVPDAGTSWFLARALGPSAAFDIAARAASITPEQAHNAGLVEHVVATDQVLPTAHRLAAELAERPGPTLALTKQLLQAAPDRTLAESLALEAQLQAHAVAGLADDP